MNFGKVYPAVFGVCLAVMALFLAGCAQPTPERAEATTETVRVATKRVQSSTQAWIEQMLVQAQAGGPFKEEVECADSCGDGGSSGQLASEDTSESGQSLGGCFRINVGTLSEKDIFLFIDEGYASVPELMKYVRDNRPTGWTFGNPLSSGLDLEPKMVGKVACYLIEAVLRQNPHFTRSYRFLYEPPLDLDEAEGEEWALHQAAEGYEKWFEDCFDEGTMKITCSPDQMPDVKWDYDLDWWEWYRNSSIKRGGDAWEQIVGKTIVSSKAGRWGYMLLLTDDAWLSCFLSEHDADGIDWHFGLSEPQSKELALLGLEDIDGGLSAGRENSRSLPDLAELIAKVHGKTLTGLGLSHTVWPIFSDGSHLWAEVGYDAAKDVKKISVWWRRR